MYFALGCIVATAPAMGQQDLPQLPQRIAMPYSVAAAPNSLHSNAAQQHVDPLIGILAVAQYPASVPGSPDVESELQQAREALKGRRASPGVKAIPGVRTLKCETPPIVNFPRWSGYPIQKCIYTDSGVTSNIWTLALPIDLLARWTVTACHDVDAKSMSLCIAALARRIIKASSGIFPVDGFIPEPAKAAGGSGNEMHCYRFRDGVTVPSSQSTESVKSGEGCPDVDPGAKAPAKAKKFARIASTTRQEYKDACGSIEVGTDVTGNPHWIDVIRQTYQEAWTSDRNVLISAAARSISSTESQCKR